MLMRDVQHFFLTMLNMKLGNPKFDMHFFFFLFFQMKQIIKTWSWNSFKNIFNKLHINTCLNDLKEFFVEKEWMTNSNMLNYDSSYSNFIHGFIE
jgi:hypothetical protein